MTGLLYAEGERARERRQDRIARVAFRLFYLVLAVALVAGSCEARAQETQRRAQIEHLGQDGIWFRLDVAREILASLEQIEPLRLRVGLLEEQVRLRGEQVDLLRQALNASRESESRLLRAVDAAERRRRRAEERLGAWWRSPWLWGATGVLVGGGVSLYVATR